MSSAPHSLHCFCCPDTLAALVYLLSLSLQWLLLPSPFYGSSLANSANYIVRSKEKGTRSLLLVPVLQYQSRSSSVVNRVSWAAFSVTRNGQVWRTSLSQNFMKKNNYLNQRMAQSLCKWRTLLKVITGFLFPLVWVNCRLNLTEAYMVKCLGQWVSHRPAPCFLELQLLLSGRKQQWQLRNFIWYLSAVFTARPMWG